MPVGAAVGTAVGAAVGFAVGTTVGVAVGATVGDGEAVGAALGVGKGGSPLPSRPSSMTFGGLRSVRYVVATPCLGRRGPATHSATAQTATAARTTGTSTTYDPVASKAAAPA